MFTTTNKTTEVFEKDYDQGDIVYIIQGYMDVEAECDLREVFTEPSVAYAIGARKIPEDSPLKASLPQPEKYQVIYGFSPDGRKAKVTWEVGTTVNMPENY